tara:strand:+ start:1466 stop:1780 length:315 start_codon:yes stop_codon:yes gene_type:complete
MAFTPYHNINGANGVNIELIKAGDNTRGIKSILIANTRSGGVSISLFIKNLATGDTFGIFRGVNIPQGSSLIVDDKPTLSFDGNKFGLYATVGSSDTMDILINT